MFDAKAVGKRIKDLRGKTPQEQCAKDLGISRGALSFYENGERKPDAEILVRMCEYFKVSADYLLGLSEVASVKADVQTACKVTGLSEKAINRLANTKDNTSGYDKRGSGNLGLNHLIESMDFIEFSAPLHDIYVLFKRTEESIFESLYCAGDTVRSIEEVENEIEKAFDLVSLTGFHPISNGQYIDLCLTNASFALQKAFQDWKEEIVSENSGDFYE